MKTLEVYMHKTVLQNWQVDVAKMKIIEIGTIEWDTLIYVFQETTTLHTFLL